MSSLAIALFEARSEDEQHEVASIVKAKLLEDVLEVRPDRARRDRQPRRDRLAIEIVEHAPDDLRLAGRERQTTRDRNPLVVSNGQPPALSSGISEPAGRLRRANQERTRRFHHPPGRPDALPHRLDPRHGQLPPPRVSRARINSDIFVTYMPLPFLLVG